MPRPDPVAQKKTQWARAMGPLDPAFGLELARFNIDNISLPEEVEAAIDKRSGMSVVGNLNDYVKLQRAEGLGKGAAIGAVIGAAGGAGSVFVTGKESLELPQGTELTIRAGSPR